MRILFSQHSLAAKRTGVGNYTYHLMNALREQPDVSAVDCFPLGLVWQLQRVQALLLPLLNRAKSRSGWFRFARVLKLPAGLLHHAATGAYHCAQKLAERQFRALVETGQYDLYHEPNFIPKSCDLPTITTLHDFSVLLHPEWHPARRVKLFEQQFQRGLLQSQHFITVSETIRQEAIHTINIPSARITGVYNGIDAHFQPWPVEQAAEALSRLQVLPNYLLYVGTLEPRKNILMLMKAYCALPSRLRERCPLLLAGGWGWKHEAMAEFYHRRARHMGVRHLGYVADEHLPALYNGARALVYPSFYEGFGLPCVEMLACGGAVLASTADAITETVGGQAKLIPAADEAGWRDAMALVIEDNEFHELLRQGATARAKRYNWANCAAETMDVYRRVCGAASSVPANRQKQLSSVA